MSVPFISGSVRDVRGCQPEVALAPVGGWLMIEPLKYMADEPPPSML